MGFEPANRSRLKVFVAGAGTMGHGLALVMAKAGHEVHLLDLDEEILKKALGLIESHLRLLSESGEIEASSIPVVLGDIHTTRRIEHVSRADLVLESIVEDVEAKRAFYEDVAGRVQSHAVISSNTSYLNIFELAPQSIQQRLLISHFYAPPYLIPLVEMVKGPGTDPGVAPWMKELLEAAGQKPIVMEKFIAGFIVNRLQRAMAREIFHLLDGGYAGAEEIDRAVLASLGVRIPVLGVVRRYDFAGLDFALKVLSNPSIHLVNEDRPSKALQRLVSENRLGVKTGQGFYDYRGSDLKDVYHKRDRLLMRARKLIEEIEDEFWNK